ncbi:MAG: transcription antitermination factor NusB [Bacteroidota bacterium]
MINRRAVREVVLQSLYAYEVGGNPIKEIRAFLMEKKLGGDTDALRFAEKLFLLTLEESDELDNIIEKHINNWDIHRLAMLDKLILRIAICELLHFEEIPTKVTINEAIELAKAFSTAKSGRFVNGVVDAAMEQLKSDGKLVKKGRGLIDLPRKPGSGPNT